MVHLGSLVIRQAHQQDFDKIDKMFRANAPHDPDRHLYKILELIEPDSIAIATNGGQPVGCAYGHFHGDGIGIIGGLFIKRGYSNGGTLDALLKSCMTHLRRRNCSDLIAMISQEDQFSQCYTDLGFNIWRRKVWSFVQAQSLSSRENGNLSIESVRASDVDLRKFESDLIPTRFWYRRLSQELTERMNAYQTGSQESSSLVVWRDVSALRVNAGKYPQYFLFDERCASLTQIGEKAIVREISLGIGPKRFELIKRAAKDSLEKGIEVLLIHKDPDDQLPFSEDEIPARFSAPRRILRSSIGSSLDAFLGGRPKIDEGLPMFAYAPIAEDS